MAAAGEDPRLLSRLEADAGVRPVVATPRGGAPMWVLVAGLAAAAILLFLILNARRQALDTPAADPRIAVGPVVSAAPPPLVIPPGEAAPLEPVRAVVVPPLALAPAPAPARPEAAPAQPQIVYVPQPVPTPAPQPFVNPPEAPTPPPSTTPALIIDVGAATAAPTGTPAATAVPTAPGSNLSGTASYGGRSRAGTFANRATTIPQGALIPAVLETALDSSRPGIARAVVSRDVRGFDGSRVLVPRGSRLIGDYRADANAGQRRAMINWTRLVRPDGVTIALDSPAGDPLGRGGIGARVNGNFLSRFLGSVLGSAVDIGVALAGGRNQQTVIVTNGADSAVQTVQPEQPVRTLTVRAGTSISVLVARDLDFTGVGSAR